MTRFNAFAIHLGISFIIFLFLAYLVVFEWYPGIFFDTDGGWRGMRIIIGVDIVLGPLLTLVAFKPGKPGLKFDMTCIGLLQTVCLIAGTYVVWSERPLAVVYVDSRFEVVTTDDYGEAVPDLSIFPGDYPKAIMVDVPQDLDAQAELREGYFRDRRSLATATDLYKPFDPTDPLFTQDARDITAIEQRDGGPAAIAEWLAEHGGAIEDYRFYTYSTRYVFRYIGYHKETGRQIGFLSIKPL